MTPPANKKFKLQADEIRRLVTGYGSCIASDYITVRGQKVGFAYREVPDNGIDSGWRFMAGSESQEYINDPNNLSIYDVNTIANYDPDVVTILDSPIGSAFERKDGTAPFTQVCNLENLNE